jgi:hypothetical protein
MDNDVAAGEDSHGTTKERRGRWRMKPGDVWCRIAHAAPMWPMHAQYECRICGRRFPVPWAERNEAHARGGPPVLIQALATCASNRIGAVAPITLSPAERVRSPQRRFRPQILGLRITL